MAFGIRKFIEGILVKNSTDTTKEVELKVSNSATTATKTTILASQTANVTVTLPDSTSTLATTGEVAGKADLDLNNIDPIAADLIPDGNITRAIGSTTAAWSGVYTSQLTDSSNDASYVVDTRVTYDTSSTVSVDADARLLKSSAGNKIGWSGTDNTTYAHIVPSADNTLQLGNATNRYNTVFTNAITTSGASSSVILGASAELRDAVGDTSVDWPNRQLQSGATVKLDWSGTDVSLNTRKLTNVVDPTSAQDAATKNYVDSSSAGNLAVTTKTANYTLTGADSVVIGDVSGGAFTLTLPTAVGITGKVFTIKYGGGVGQNQLIIATTSAQTIDGISNIYMTSFGDVTRLMSDGSNWVEISASRVVGARYHSSTTAAVVGDVVMIQPSVTYDTYGSYNTGNGQYTIMESGLYTIDCSWQINAGAFSTTQDMTILIYVNASPIPGGNLGYMVGNGATNFYTVQGSDTLQLNQGSVVTIILRSTVAGACTTNSFFSISKIK